MTRRRRLIILGSATALVLASFVLGVAALHGQASAGSSTAARTAGATVLTTRGDLQQVQTVPGTVDYGEATVRTGRGSGTITWLPAVGGTIRRGHMLWRVNDAPVVLFYGSIPLYRTLSTTGVAQAGDDVDLVAANLRALGYWSGPVRHATYGRYLADALRAWQRALHIPDDGVVGPHDVVVATGAIRVDDVTAHVADAAYGPVLSTTGTRRVVTLKVPAQLASTLQIGAAVTVSLPDGGTAPGDITAIGSSVEGQDGASATAQVTVHLTRGDALAGKTLGAITAEIVTAERQDVVQVPVNALLAVTGGGYALQRPDLALFPVRVGMVAGGMVEVTGVAAGVRVLVAA